MTDLEQRIARLEARADIEQLLQRYTLFIDSHRFEELGELFTEDAVFGSHETRTGIVEFYRERGEMYPISLHLALGMVLEFDGDDSPPMRAHATVHGYSEQAGGGHTIATVVQYEDQYVREDGQWRFAVRVVNSLYALSHAEVAAGGLGWELRNRWPHREARPAELPADMRPDTAG